MTSDDGTSSITKWDAAKDPLVVDLSLRVPLSAGCDSGRGGGAGRHEDHVVRFGGRNYRPRLDDDRPKELSEFGVTLARPRTEVPKQVLERPLPRDEALVCVGIDVREPVVVGDRVMGGFISPRLVPPTVERLRLSQLGHERLHRSRPLIHDIGTERVEPPREQRGVTYLAREATLDPVETDAGQHEGSVTIECV